MPLIISLLSAGSTKGDFLLEEEENIEEHGESEKRERGQSDGGVKIN